MINSIALPTDFSDAGRLAFAHALRLAVSFRCKLDLLHVRAPGDRSEWDKFPHVRETLEKWGLLPIGSDIEDIEEQLGVTVQKVDIRDSNAVDGLSRYLAQHRPDLLVMATHGRTGLNRWLSGSVSSDVAVGAGIPALLLGPLAQPVVDPASGVLTLDTVAVPVDREPDPQAAIAKVEAILGPLGASLSLFHVGIDVPDVKGPDGEALPVSQMGGDIVEMIVGEGEKAGLLAMPTAGRHGFLDALTGSTTEQVLHKAVCPVLAVPCR